jgi:tripartite ATP-independent transporter DctP family solute receptor
MLKKFRCLALVMVLVLILVSCVTFAANDQISITFGSLWKTSSFLYKSDAFFKNLVETNSKGQIKIKYYPDAQLGPQTEQIQAVRSGAQQMVVTSTGVLAPYWSQLGTFDLPYLYRDEEHYIKVVNKITSLITQNEMVAKTGMRILSARIRPARQLTTKFPVNKLEDIKGIKMRVPEIPVSVALWKALGTVPTVIPGAEALTALAIGVVVAQENPLNDIYNSKIYEITKYCALTSHMREMIVVLINNSYWKSLTVKQKKILQDAGVKSLKFSVNTGLEVDKEDYQNLTKAGMTFTKPDLAPFRKAAQKIWKQFGDEKMINKVEAIK